MIIYDILIRAFDAILPILSHSGNVKLSKFASGRCSLSERIHESLSGYEGKTVWMHCSSLGEFEQGRPLLEALRKEKPNDRIVLTFFSPSGYEPMYGYEGVDFVFYLPIDSKPNVRRFLDDVNPSIVYFVKYEFWPNYLIELKKRGIRTYLISAIFRKGQSFFKWYGSFMRKVLKSFTGYFVQDENSRLLLSSIGIGNVKVTGDTRFDRVYMISKRRKMYADVEKFIGDNVCSVFGSTWPADEEIIVRYINQMDYGVKYILVPHEVDEKNVSRLCSMIGKSYVRYSEYDETMALNSEVLVIDTVGMLSSLYGYADISYVGGGFGKDGIHNCLEPAVFGIPVLFGPNYSKYNEAVGLVGCGGAVPINGYEDFKHIFSSLVENQSLRRTQGEKSSAYIGTGIGATSQILSFSEN